VREEPPARSAGDGDDRRLEGRLRPSRRHLVCDADIVDAPAPRELNRRVHLKYVTERGLELDAVKPYLATDDITLRLRPTTVSSWDLRNTEQGRALLESGAFHRLEPVH
jgi:hypothetical protein